MKDRKIILASASPRRRELLSSLGFEFTVIPSQYQETLDAQLDIKEAVERLSYYKAEDIHKSHFCDIVVGADTIVVLDGNVLCKPKDEYDARKMLRMLSGRTHTVYTAVTLICEEDTISFVSETEVSFFDLTDEEIDEYIISKEPLDKAGAYGIQGKGAYFVKSINGDYYSVMGLPIASVAREINAMIKRKGKKF